MQFLMWNAKIAERWPSSSRMRSPETVHTVKKRFAMIGKILVADSGVHLHHLMLGAFVPILKDQKTDFTGINLHNHSLVRTQRAALHQFSRSGFRKNHSPTTCVRARLLQSFDI
jgi:hypothetical protein